ncbi:metalloendopeptidase [Sphingomonas sp. Leaf339]|uniref:murein hydrolase activator EnvC family protein n=1 Tax=Sphingomonas sp. Leaf339 TaxID=1736343 RepID=UPI0006FCE4DF|nr:peptidoglycan DD-metalloendopeptidase family protein [Sphingomonas sp. Leaf339]KQU61922.1 metalloendopeptidase [Sphingomonas sp. Leaf339]
MWRPSVRAMLAISLTASVAAHAPADANDPLLRAQQEAAAASARADRLKAAAAAESDAAAQAAVERRGLTARVAVAAAGLRSAAAKAAIVDRRLAERRARLAAEQAPVARLLAALQSLARQPAAVAVMQPGSIDDLVHIRAVLGTVMPAVRALTAAVRGQLDGTRTLLAQATQARDALDAARARLDRERTALAQLESQHRERAAALGRGALSEQDRALALGERARDLVDRLAEEGEGQAIVAGLTALTGPVPRPVAAGSVGPARPTGAYRLPVAGRLVTGFGEISAAGVRSRGLTFAVPAGTPVVAPAGGTVRYAQGFRGYGGIVIVDHGDGWTSLVTGLAKPIVAVGGTVRMGDPIGRAAGGDYPRVTVELRRRGQPMDMVALIG